MLAVAVCTDRHTMMYTRSYSAYICCTCSTFFAFILRVDATKFVDWQTTEAKCALLKFYYDVDWSILVMFCSKHLYWDAIVILIMYAIWFDL